MQKPIIYQLLPRTFANFTDKTVRSGSLLENGCGKLNNITSKALREIRRLGATHIWYTGLIEHATTTSFPEAGIEGDNPLVVKGKAGSPYAIKDYYDIAPELAEDVPNRMHEAEALFERTHKAGLKIIMDFVPNHVARQYKSNSKPAGVRDIGEDDNPEWAFSPLNDFYYLPGQHFCVPLTQEKQNIANLTYTEYPAKATGNDCFSASPSVNDWYETVKLNYGVYYQGGMEKQFFPRPRLWDKMLDILLFWCGKGIDGFRCDMAEMVPVEFWHWVIEEVKKQYPKAMFIAEVYNPSLYRSYIFEGGFDYLYDKVGMYDYLRGVTSRDFDAEGITRQWQNTEDIRRYMLYFLENHDEQRIASGFFCGRGICAEPAMIVATCLGENPLLIYAGQETGEAGMQIEGFSGIDGRTSIFDYCTVPSLQAWTNHGNYDGALMTDEQRELRAFYHTLLNLANAEPALREGLMFDLEYVQQEGFNKKKHYAFLRKAETETLLIVVNFDARTEHVKIQLPPAAFTYLVMEERDSVAMTDLLTGKSYQQMPFNTTQPVELQIPAWQGLILKIQM
ncbi:MAG: alpha-amylase [Paludibacteraceae bacterium]|nr:alpha-amylase [Paludibacteraceae bacterium]